jgi:hypothetical protein
VSCQEEDDVVVEIVVVDLVPEAQSPSHYLSSVACIKPHQHPPHHTNEPHNDHHANTCEIAVQANQALQQSRSLCEPRSNKTRGHDGSGDDDKSRSRLCKSNIQDDNHACHPSKRMMSSQGSQKAKRVVLDTSMPAYDLVVVRKF